MKKAKRINSEPVLYGVIGTFITAIALSVAASILIYNEVLPENRMISVVASALAGVVGGLMAGKRAGKGPLPMALLSAGIYLVISLLLGQMLFDGVGETMYLTILAVLLGAAAGGILAANKSGSKHRRKARRT